MAECAGNRRDVLSEIQLSVDEVLKSFLHGYNLFQGFSAPASLRGEQVVARTAVGKDSEPVELPGELAGGLMGAAGRWGGTRLYVSRIEPQLAALGPQIPGKSRRRSWSSSRSSG